ncbi:MAG: Fic family protein [Pseudomonadota bacterium]|nr:Fic family protein [Pseudomonadota bacterium]
MKDSKPDKETDIFEVRDGHETVSMMEPLLISEQSRHRPALADLAVELAARSAGFYHRLPEGLASALADLVRSMNCYYSNLIEGHNTHPVDIEKALRNDYSTDSKKRDLQLEARAHIEVQLWIDKGGLSGNETSVEGICELHRRFCEHLPEELQWAKDPATGKKIKITPGELRKRDVQVGGHIAISPAVVAEFMKHFSNTYGRLGLSETIIASAAAHHRLVWIHPFLDGNGRVARLMSHAMLLKTLDTGGIWSISRGLARNEAEYKKHLSACDLTRRNDLDGRGNLSEEALADFTKFFLEACLDQVNFMEQLIKPDQLRTRILLWADEEIAFGKLPKPTKSILEPILYRGVLPRSEVAGILGASTRHARRVTEALSEFGIIKSDTSRAPWKLVFPASLASRWMPGLFPEQSS